MFNLKGFSKNKTFNDIEILEKKKNYFEQNLIFIENDYEIENLSVDSDRTVH